MARIGEDVSERLDVVPAQLRVAKLEAARQPRLSPFAPFDVFEARCREQMAAGELAKDFPIDALARWESDGTWQAAYGRWR